MIKIADELDTVINWETLASWLDVKQGKIDGIDSNCRGKGGDVADCCRSMLVRTFCELETGTVKDVVEKIAKALEKMGKNLQADKLRKLDLGKSSYLTMWVCHYSMTYTLVWYIRIGSEDDELETAPVPPTAESGTCPSDDPHCSATSTKSSISKRKQPVVPNTVSSDSSSPTTRPLPHEGSTPPPSSQPPHIHELSFIGCIMDKQYSLIECIKQYLISLTTEAIVIGGVVSLVPAMLLHYFCMQQI